VQRVLELLDGVLCLFVIPLCLSSGMRLNGRHGSSGATGTSPGNVTSGRQDELASSTGIGKYLCVLVYGSSRNPCTLIFQIMFLFLHGVVIHY
jgi:hypothetical protein